MSKVYKEPAKEIWTNRLIEKKGVAGHWLGAYERDEYWHTGFRDVGTEILITLKEVLDEPKL